MAGAGLGMSAYGMWLQGQDAAARGSLIAGADEYEARQDEIQGQQQGEYLQRQSTRLQGKNEATVASGNEDVTTGSPALAIIDQVTQDQKAMAIAKSNAQHKALSARLAGAQGEQAGNEMERASNLSAAGGLLTGGAKLYNMTSRGPGSTGNSSSGSGLDFSSFYGRDS